MKFERLSSSLIQSFDLLLSSRTSFTGFAPMQDVLRVFSQMLPKWEQLANNYSAGTKPGTELGCHYALPKTR